MLVGGQVGGKGSHLQLSRPMCVSSRRKKHWNRVPKGVLTLNYKTICRGLEAAERKTCVSLDLSKFSLPVLVSPQKSAKNMTNCGGIWQYLITEVAQH